MFYTIQKAPMTITRVGFCPHCFKAQRPRTDNFFVVHGKNWHVYRANHISNPGYTPHLYRLLKTIGENVIVEKICGMHECGSVVWWDNVNQCYAFSLQKWERTMLTIKQWNALLNLKDSGYEI